MNSQIDTEPPTRGAHCNVAVPNVDGMVPYLIIGKEGAVDRIVNELEVAEHSA